MSLYPPKRPGFCTRCGEAVFEILEWIVIEGMVTDQPRRIGAPLPTMTQVEFRWLGPPDGNPSTGSRTHLSFCRPCADAMTPAEYPQLRRLLLDGWRASMRGPHWTPALIRQEMKTYADLIFAGPLWRRTWTGDDPTPRIDRR